MKQEISLRSPEVRAQKAVRKGKVKPESFFKIKECTDILAFIYQHCSFKQKHTNKTELVGSRGMDWEGERLYFSRNTDYTQVTCSSPFLQALLQNVCSGIWGPSAPRRNVFIYEWQYDDVVSHDSRGSSLKAWLSLVCFPGAKYTAMQT